MGLIYSKSESQNLIRVMEGNLVKVGSILQSLTQASKQLTSVLGVELKGQAYSTGLAVFDDIILPTMQHASTAIEELSQGLSSYRALDSAMPNEILDEDNLNEQIRIRQNMVSSLHHQSRLLQYQQGEYDLVSQTNLLHHLTSHMQVLEEEIRQLQEKVRKLGEFSSSTSGLFTTGQNYLLASLRGVNVLKHATVHPQTGAYLLRGGVSLLDLQVQGVGDDFQSRLQKMSLAEIEEKYGNIIRVNVNNVYIGAGYDSRYAGSKLSPKEIDAIRARYQYLVAAGHPNLDFMTMLEHLDPDDKSRIDQMTLLALSQQNISFLQYGPQFSWNYITGSPQDRARLNYLYYRFNQLMAQQPIDWRDPDFANKYYAYIKQTGINPITGNQATPNDKLVAKQYGWLRHSSTILAIVADGMIDYSDLSAYFLTKGKIPSVAYDDIRIRSIHNPDSNEMTLGKYRPIILPDGTEDWTIPGPDSYIVKAGDTTYFSLGDDWNKITAEYGLDTKGEEMFKYFNVPALDDAVAQGKTIRFSHDPTLPQYEGQAIDWEWTYLREKHGYKRFKQIGDYWYAIK